MQKIAIVSQHFCYPEHLNGTSKIIVNIFSSEESKKYKIDYYFSRDDKEIQYEPSSNPHIIFKPIDVKPLSRIKKMLRWSSSLLPFHTYTGSNAKQFIELMSKDKYDLIIIFGLNLAPIALCLHSTSKVRFAPIDSLTLNFSRRVAVEKNLFKKIVWRIESIKNYHYEKKIHQSLKRIVYVSKVDGDFAKTVFGKNNNISIAPLGVRQSKQSRSHHSLSNKIIFSGNMSYGPNFDTANFIINKIAPKLLVDCPDIQISLAGHESNRLINNQSNVSLCGFVDDLDSLIEEHDLVIAPLTYGSGMKFKTLDALLKSKPVIGSKIAFEGIDISPYQSRLEVNPNHADEWVKAIAKYYEKPNEFNENSIKLANRLKEIHDWDKITRIYFS